MHGIYANIGGILMVNVTIYGIHGSYGYKAILTIIYPCELLNSHSVFLTFCWLNHVEAIVYACEDHDALPVSSLII